MKEKYIGIIPGTNLEKAREVRNFIEDISGYQKLLPVRMKILGDDQQNDLSSFDLLINLDNPSALPGDGLNMDGILALNVCAFDHSAMSSLWKIDLIMKTGAMFQLDHKEGFLRLNGYPLISTDEIPGVLLDPRLMYLKNLYKESEEPEEYLRINEQIRFLENRWLKLAADMLAIAEKDLKTYGVLMGAFLAMLEELEKEHKVPADEKLADELFDYAQYPFADVLENHLQECLPETQILKNDLEELKKALKVNHSFQNPERNCFDNQLPEGCSFMQACSLAAIEKEAGHFQYALKILQSPNPDTLAEQLIHSLLTAETQISQKCRNDQADQNSRTDRKFQNSISVLLKAGQLLGTVNEENNEYLKAWKDSFTERILFDLGLAYDLNGEIAKSWQILNEALILAERNALDEPQIHTKLLFELLRQMYWMNGMFFDERNDETFLNKAKKFLSSDMVRLDFEEELLWVEMQLITLYIRDDEEEKYNLGLENFDQLYPLVESRKNLNTWKASVFESLIQDDPYEYTDFDQEQESLLNQLDLAVKVFETNKDLDLLFQISALAKKGAAWLIDHGKSEDALDMMRKAADAAAADFRAEAVYQYALLLVDIAFVYINSEQSARALELINEGIALVDTINQDFPDLAGNIKANMLSTKSLVHENRSMQEEQLEVLELWYEEVGRLMKNGLSLPAEVFMVWLRLAGLYEEKGMAKEALDCLQKLNECFDKLSFETDEDAEFSKAALLNELGGVCKSAGLIDESIEAYEASLKLWKELNDRLPENLNGEIGIVCYNLGLLHDILRVNAANASGEEAGDFSVPGLNKPEQKREETSRESGKENKKENTEKSQKESREKIRKTKAAPIGKVAELLLANPQIGSSHFGSAMNLEEDALKHADLAIENYEQAISYYGKATEEGLDYLDNKARALNNLSGIYSESGLFDKAEETQNESLGIRRIQCETDLEQYADEYLMSLENRTNMSLIREEYDEAIPYLEEKIELLKKLSETNRNYLPYYGSSLNQLGALKFEKGDYDFVIEMAEIQKQIWRETSLLEPELIPEMSLTLFNEGLAYARKKNLSQAVHAFNESRKILTEDENTSLKEKMIREGECTAQKFTLFEECDDLVESIRVAEEEIDLYEKELKALGFDDQNNRFVNLKEEHQLMPKSLESLDVLDREDLSESEKEALYLLCLIRTKALYLTLLHSKIVLNLEKVPSKIKEIRKLDDNDEIRQRLLMLTHDNPGRMDLIEKHIEKANSVIERLGENMEDDEQEDQDFPAAEVQELFNNDLLQEAKRIEGELDAALKMEERLPGQFAASAAARLSDLIVLDLKTGDFERCFQDLIRAEKIFSSPLKIEVDERTGANLVLLASMLPTVFLQNNYPPEKEEETIQQILSHTENLSRALEQNGYAKGKMLALVSCWSVISIFEQYQTDAGMIERVFQQVNEVLDSPALVQSRDLDFYYTITSILAVFSEIFWEVPAYLNPGLKDQLKKTTEKALALHDDFTSSNYCSLMLDGIGFERVKNLIDESEIRLQLHVLNMPAEKVLPQIRSYIKSMIRMIEEGTEENDSLSVLFVQPIVDLVLNEGLESLLESELIDLYMALDDAFFDERISLGEELLEILFDLSEAMVKINKKRALEFYKKLMIMIQQHLLYTEEVNDAWWLSLSHAALKRAEIYLDLHEKTALEGRSSGDLKQAVVMLKDARGYSRKAENKKTDEYLDLQSTINQLYSRVHQFRNQPDKAASAVIRAAKDVLKKRELEAEDRIHAAHLYEKALDYLQDSNQVLEAKECARQILRLAKPYVSADDTAAAVCVVADLWNAAFYGEAREYERSDKWMDKAQKDLEALFGLNPELGQMFQEVYEPFQKQYVKRRGKKKSGKFF